jgi:CubicO group peptidase (beta-lactamase class C family)
MKKYIIIATLFFVSGFNIATMAQSGATITKQTITPQILHRLDSLYHYLDSTGLYNGNILVAAGGKKVSSASIGYANLDTKEKLTEASSFTLASISKQFTAVGILRLVQAGKIKLDQQVSTILPGFPYAGVTVRQLLNHTGGLPDYARMMDEHWDKSKIASNADMLKMLIEKHPEATFKPGTQWEYSNTGYALLASIMETVSGKSYAAYMQEQVFTPFGLKQTTVFMPRYVPKKIKGYAYSYVRKEDGSYVQPDSVAELDFVRFLDGVGGQGRVVSTVTDLLKWNNALRDRKILSAELWNEAITAPVINGKSTDYGFGLIVAPSPERGRVLRHTGSWPAYITNNVLYLDKDISLIYLTNKEQAQDVYDATFETVKNIVFEKPFSFPQPLVQKLAVVDPTIYSRYTGVYATTEMEGFELSVSEKEGKLYLQATGQPATVLSPESDNMFFIAGEPIKIEFKTDANNMANVLVLYQNGVHEFKRK